VRVGVVGTCRYEGERLIGISDISSLVFRFPTGECEFGEELYELYASHSPRGVLIYSPPGVGKTTALRYLAERLGAGDKARCVVVVDERCEFLREDYERARVDILSGYKKRLGIEIAIRTLSAETVILDELGADDVASIMDVMRFGVPFVASAHAGSAEEILNKPSLRPLFESGAVDMLVGIERSDIGYRLNCELLD
jgi:stage III sporulation protein AA